MRSSVLPSSRCTYVQSMIHKVLYSVIDRICTSASTGSQPTRRKKGQAQTSKARTKVLLNGRQRVNKLGNVHTSYETAAGILRRRVRLEQCDTPSLPRLTVVHLPKKMTKLESSSRYGVHDLPLSSSLGKLGVPRAQTSQLHHSQVGSKPDRKRSSS